MISLRELQHQFLDCLLEKPSKISQEIVSNDHASAESRLALYAEGYKLRLKEVLEYDYEQLNTYLGDELFDQVMEQYITEYQSHGPNLRYYTQNFPKMLEESLPWSGSPELAELAAIEKVFSDSFDSMDRKSVTIDTLAQIEPTDWPTLKVRFQNAVHLIETKFNSFIIWQALSNDEDPPTLKDESSQWLVWRSNLITSYIGVSDAECAAYLTMSKGGDFSDLCEVLLEYYSEEETPMQAVALLQGWLSKEMIYAMK